MARTKRTPVEELLHWLDAKLAETGNRNYAVARMKVSDAATYIQRGEREGRVEADRGQEYVGVVTRVAGSNLNSSCGTQITHTALSGDGGTTTITTTLAVSGTIGGPTASGRTAAAPKQAWAGDYDGRRPVCCAEELAKGKRRAHGHVTTYGNSKILANTSWHY